MYECDLFSPVSSSFQKTIFLYFFSRSKWKVLSRLLLEIAQKKAEKNSLLIVKNIIYNKWKYIYILI